MRRALTTSRSSAAGGGAFPATRRSVVLAVASGEEEVRRQAFGSLVEAYWRPSYKLLRLRWGLGPTEAEDATQDFFARALEKGWFARYDPARARFRTYLRTCLDGFAANRRKAARREKRGGGVAHVSLDAPSVGAGSLDFAAAEGELAHLGPADHLSAEELFHREWVRGVFQLAIERLRRGLEANGRGLRFRLFEQYDLEGDDGGPRPTYGELAAEHGVAVTRVTNELAAARRELRRRVLELLREITGSEAEYRDEARALLGVDPP
jgi:DNA-directed RNA polymerase specialized sigma24 family protein